MEREKRRKRKHWLTRNKTWTAQPWGWRVAGTAESLPGTSPCDSSLCFPAWCFSLTSISNGQGSWLPAAAGACPYNLRNPNVKLWYENPLIVLVCGRCPPWDDSLWPKSHKQLATPGGRAWPRADARKEESAASREGGGCSANTAEDEQPSPIHLRCFPDPEDGACPEE